MKQTQFYIAIALSAVCLILSLWMIAVGQASQSALTDWQKRQNEIQSEIQNRQAEVNKGVVSDRVGGAIVQDLASVALKNPKVKDLLAKHGYNVTAAPSPGAATSPTP
jgi:hypothetical protein